MTDHAALTRVTHALAPFMCGRTAVFIELADAD